MRNMCQQKLKGWLIGAWDGKKSRSSWDPVYSIPNLSQLRFCETGNFLKRKIYFFMLCKKCVSLNCNNFFSSFFSSSLFTNNQVLQYLLNINVLIAGLELCSLFRKLDWAGPFDNRTSTDQFCHIVKKNQLKKIPKKSLF